MKYLFKKASKKKKKKKKEDIISVSAYCRELLSLAVGWTEATFHLDYNCGGTELRQVFSVYFFNLS